MAQMPSSGPNPNQGKSMAKSCEVARLVNSSMLTMEVPKPIQVVSVRTLPTACGGALLAVSVENCGESPAAVMPHTMSHVIMISSGAEISQGESKQHRLLTLN